MNNKPKRYRLLKDLPGLKSGTEIRWSKLTGGYRYYEPNHFFVAHNYEDDMRDTLKRELVENNPEWFEEIKEPEKIEGDDLVGLLRDCVSRTWGNPSLTQTQELFDDFLVERQLVSMSAKQMNRQITRMVNEILLDKKYTQEELDKAIVGAFNAARMNTDNIFLSGFAFKYQTLQHYLKYIKESE